MRASVAKAQDAQFQKRTEARRQLGHWEGWRDLSAEIRQHVIKHLPDYLEEFSDNVQKNGGHVFFAKDGDEASTFIKQLAIKKQAHHIVKSKSMVTTEIGLDKELLTIPGLSLMETDLAEFILQEDNWDEPTHIVFPTLHKNRNQIQKVLKNSVMMVITTLNTWQDLSVTISVITLCKLILALLAVTLRLLITG